MFSLCFLATEGEMDTGKDGHFSLWHLRIPTWGSHSETRDRLLRGQLARTWEAPGWLKTPSGSALPRSKRG